RALVAFVDEGLVGAVWMFLSLDQKIKPASMRAEGDVFVALSLACAPEPRMFGRTGLQPAMDPRDSPNVVEHHVVVGVLRDHAAGLEDPAPLRRGDEGAEA